MRNEKISFEQYLVKGKKRNFRVVKIPRRRYGYAVEYEAWGFEGNERNMMDLCHALAALLADSEIIIYFQPGYDNEVYGHYTDCRDDFIICSSSLQFKRSEWYNLRKQLNPRNKIDNFKFVYRPDRLCKEFETVDRKYSYKNDKLFDNHKCMCEHDGCKTVFFVSNYYWSLYYHNQIRPSLTKGIKSHECVEEFGYWYFNASMFTTRTVGLWKLMKEKEKKND